MTINEAQSTFKRSMIAGRADPKILRNFKPAGRLSLSEAFQIYHDSYIARMSEVLAETYSAVLWVLGTELFHELCHKYILSQPSVNYHLNDYGETFPEFLRDHPSSQGIAFLYSLGKFEWIYKSITGMASPRPLTPQRISELLQSGDYRIRFIDALEIFESQYSVFDIWKKRTGPAYMFEDIDWERPDYLLIYKQDHQVRVEKIEAVEAKVLQAIRTGQSTTEALGAYSDVLDASRITDLFQLITRAGIVEDILMVEDTSP